MKNNLKRIYQVVNKCGLISRLFLMLEVFFKCLLVPLTFLYFCFVAISLILVWVFDICLILPLLIVWLFTGKKYFFMLEYVINKKTGFFEIIYEED